MTDVLTIPRFAGEVVLPGDERYDEHREVWNAAVDRRPAVIARCTSAEDVVAAMRHGRERGLEIAVKCGGHSVMGLAVPDGGLMLDLTPMNAVRVDAEKRRAWVQGGSLLRNLDRATEPHGLATTAGNVSHTGVGGLTLGGGMGWLARQFGLASDNVAAYTVVTADGQVVRASADEHPDLFWGLRGGGGNFGVVTEFEFRLHPTSGQVLVAELTYEPADGVAADADLARPAGRGAARGHAHRRRVQHPDRTPIRSSPAALRSASASSGPARWTRAARISRPSVPSSRRPLRRTSARCATSTCRAPYDERNGHGMRRYSTGHYVPAFPDDAIDAFLSRGLAPGAPEPDWSLMPNSGFQAHGGAIADVGDDESAFSFRDTIIEWVAGTTWTDPDEDVVRMANARAWARALDPWGTGAYVNVIADAGEVRRAYRDAKFAKLVELKRAWDPDNVFHLNHNIRPDAA